MQPLTSLKPCSRRDTRPADAPKKLSGSTADSETDTGDESACSGEEIVVPGPPLRPLIARAIMLSPYRHVPLSVIYAYCIRHCPFYRDNGRLCQKAVKRILSGDKCFKRLPQENSRPDYWTFDMQYKDLLEKELSEELIDATSCNPWEHDHGGYSKRLQSDPAEAGDTGPEGASACAGRLTEADAQPGPDADVALQRRLQGPATDSGGATNGDESNTERQLRCSPQRPHLQSLTSSPPSDYPFPDRPIDICDVLDIKEEPFPEELPVEDQGEQRQKLCASLLDAGCYTTVTIKQEQEEYPVTATYEMVDTQC